MSSSDTTTTSSSSSPPREEVNSSPDMVHRESTVAPSEEEQGTSKNSCGCSAGFGTTSPLDLPAKNLYREGLEQFLQQKKCEEQEEDSGSLQEKLNQENSKNNNNNHNHHHGSGNNNSSVGKSSDESSPRGKESSPGKNVSESGMLPKVDPAIIHDNKQRSGSIASSSSASLSPASSTNSGNSSNTNVQQQYQDKQTIRGRNVSHQMIETEHGAMPAVEYFNLRHRLRTVIPIEETLSLFQLWVLTPLLNTFMWLLTNVFFREVDVIGLENIPKHGPVVFYGNHQNQFMDAVMIRAHCGRPVRFIIAEKSMSRPVIGQFASLMGAVPVVRPQDVPSTVGTGKIVSIEQSTVLGQDTNFCAEVHPGDVVQWSVLGSSEKCQGQVRSIESNTKLTLTLPVEESNAVHNKPTGFKVSRRIDHSEMYAKVYSTLDNNGSIAVFPEGGSHDRTSLLPLKAGVALFSLGAAERGIVPTIIPVGLTYFYGHKFRSRAHIEFGEPILPPPEIVEEFSRDKRTATGEFLKQLETALRDVTINCEDWNTLKFIHNFRRLYQDPSVRLETIDYLRLTRRLARITTEHDSDPDFAEFRSKVENYIDFCNALFVRDAQAATLSNLKENVSVVLFFRRVAVLAVLFFTLVPFFVIAGPVGIISQLASEAHARTALSASSVKVVGADVKASYKIITGFALFPIMCFVNAGMVYYYTDDVRSAATVLLATPMAMYVSLHLVHEFILELYAALPLFISLVSNHKQFVKLHERRTRLVQMARAMVSKFDPALDSEMRVYEGVSSSVGPAPSFFSLRHRSRAAPTSVSGN